MTSVVPETTYAVRLPTKHPIYEHFRVKSFAELLREQDAPSFRTEVGKVFQVIKDHISAFDQNFAYTCQQNLFAVTNELHDPTPRRCLVVIVLSLGLYGRHADGTYFRRLPPYYEPLSA